MHDLRHTYASILASSGLSLPILGALLGHTQAQTTKRYAHLFDDPLRKARQHASGSIGPFFISGRPLLDLRRKGPVICHRELGPRLARSGYSNCYAVIFEGYRDFRGRDSRAPVFFDMIDHQTVAFVMADIRSFPGII